MVGSQGADEHHLVALFAQMKGQVLPERARALDGIDEVGVGLCALLDALGQGLGEAGVVGLEREAPSTDGAIGSKDNGLVLVFCRVDADNGLAAYAVSALLDLLCPFDGLAPWDEMNTTS